MTERRGMILLNLAIIFLFVLHATLAQQQPNIALIVADDLDADEISVTAQDTDTWPTFTGAGKMGLPEIKPFDPKVLTPHIDGLRRDGMLFTRFHVSATQCAASRYSFLTGRQATRGEDLLNLFPPGTLANLGWHPGILRKETSLPKSMKSLGYRTGIVGKWHNVARKENRGLPKRYNEDHRAQATYNHTLEYEDRIKEYYKAHVNYLKNEMGWDVVTRMEWANSVVNLPWQCKGAVKFIHENANQPFFLYVALPVPHGQYSYSYNDLDGFDDRVTSNGLITKVPNVMPSVSNVYARTDAAGVNRSNAMATRMDDYVGAILGKLEEWGLSEDTLVIFTSDHGGRGKNSCYQGGAQVPFIARWPNMIPPNSTSDSLVASVDVASTLIDVAGGTAPSDMLVDGQSFKPMLFGQPEPVDWRQSLIIEAQTTRAVVTKKWSYLANRVTPEIAEAMANRPGKVYWSGKTHHNYQTHWMYPGYWDADQLYDLENDLYQQKNLIANPSYLSSLKTLRATLDQYIAATPHSFGEFGTGVYSGAVSKSVDFTDSEGYSKGALNEANGWAGTLGHYRVREPGHQGFLRLPRRSAWRKATLNVTLPKSDVYEVTMDFTFQRQAGQLSASREIMIALITDSLDVGVDSDRLGISIERDGGGENYRLKTVNSMSTELSIPGEDFDETLLGFDAGQSWSTSAKLQLAAKLERGPDANGWTLTGTLNNLGDNATVSEVKRNLGSSLFFFSDESLFASLDSADKQSSSLAYKRDLDRFTVTTCTKPPDLGSIA